MNKAVLVIVLFLVLAGATLCAADDASMAAAAGSNLLTAIGQISDIDWVASAVTVRYMQTQGYLAYDEITLFVPRSATIQKRGRSVGLSELQIGDQLTAEYVNASPGPLKAVKITVVGQ